MPPQLLVFVENCLTPVRGSDTQTFTVVLKDGEGTVHR